MDSIGPIFFYAILGVVIFLAAGYIGFRIPAPLSWPYGEPVSDISHQPVPAGLPAAARRWFSDAHGQVVAPDTLVAWGRGRIASKLPIIGRIWLPLSWTMYLIPGSCFLIQNRITWFGRRFIRGGEEFCNGKGAFILGSDKMDADYLDETERSLVWLYSLWLAPGSLVNRNDVVLDENKDGSIRLVARTAGKADLIFNLHFDPDTGGLTSINTRRKGSRSGDDYPYLATLSRSKLMKEEQILPTSYIGDWDRDVYIKLELVDMQMNQDVSEAMQTGIVGLNS